ncbi:YraN family protein [Paenibacillus sp. UMB4589-SE434]|uniref:YraN family protein n=1 Tax=Paenibacillus sp. UMB4589-SE434 TaxID=3046314 RepID=UPI002549E3B0|nr:YraN family protein [Paenibacillus sp. UMB4589-SE434]MDK8180747.1 YraN family protein [Paenibacillus sp. UMB4589-SE434]
MKRDSSSADNGNSKARAARNKDDRRARGARAEQLAATYIESLGWMIEARNWRCRSGEIDLIARDGDCIVFIEVRSRSMAAASFGTAREALDVRKQLKVRSIAEVYAACNRLEGNKMRCDAVVITYYEFGQEPVLEHIESAF